MLAPFSLHSSPNAISSLLQNKAHFYPPSINEEGSIDFLPCLWAVCPPPLAKKKKKKK